MEDPICPHCQKALARVVVYNTQRFLVRLNGRDGKMPSEPDYQETSDVLCPHCGEDVTNEVNIT